jgi:hypothetical protein
MAGITATIDLNLLRIQWDSHSAMVAICTHWTITKDQLIRLKGVVPLAPRHDRRFRFKPKRSECHPDKSSMCPEEGDRCIEGRCYRTCDSLSCNTRERCYTVKQPGGCFVDAAGSFSLCARSDELPALFETVGGDWFEGKRSAGFSESKRLSEQITKARAVCERTDAGCSRICLSNRDCGGAGSCDCSTVVELVSGRAWAGLCTSR